MSEPSLRSRLQAASRQDQFLDVIDRDEATARFQRHLSLKPLEAEPVELAAALDRVLAEDVIAGIDVPGFDRSNVDGFAVQAADTFDASEESAKRLRLNDEVLSPGVEPVTKVTSGTATAVATGGMIPRGADAVVMIEDTELLDEQPLCLIVRRAVSPGQGISFAGTDIARGETILRAGQRLTSREIGVLAALGCDRCAVVRRPRVAILSTGDEIIPPGQPLRPGGVYDSNAAILTAAVSESGGQPVSFGVLPDDEDQLRARLQDAMDCDVVLMSGGTSKGAGDLSYRVVQELDRPGIVAHGVALKPGKPICLAVSDGTPVVILPGFPTSAVFTFHEFVAPVIRALAGLPPERPETVTATVPVRLNSERGRTEYVLVSLMQGEQGLSAYPLGKGSGSVTTFSQADGFLRLDQHTELVDAGTNMDVQLLGQKLEPADLVVIGSHCVGLDWLLGRLQQTGVRTKVMSVGSTGGLTACRRGECDLAGVHLLDPASGVYNRPFLTDALELIPGYCRRQGIVFRKDDARFAGRAPDAAARAACDDADCRMVNRNAGSGTRILIDQLLEGKQPPGYAVQAKSHNAVAAAIVQGRADWGVAIESVARAYELDFLPLQDEHYDFIVPRARAARPAVVAFRRLLEHHETRLQLAGMGFPTKDASAACS